MDMIERKKVILLNTPHLETASGSVATFDTDMRSKLKECKINFLPIQSGSGDPSPTNVRNISGWNSINGCHTRKNLLNIDALISSPSNTVNNFNFKHYLELKLKPNTYYTVSTSYNDSGLNALYANGVNGDKNGVKADTPRTILSSSDGIVFLMLYNRNGIEKFENKEVTVQLEEGNIVTSYEPVNNIPVSWQSEAGTLYGGYVDLAKGELVVTHKMVDMGDLDWIRHNSTNYFRCSWTQDSFANTIEGFALDTFCSCYKGVNQGRFISGSGENLNYVFNTTYISSSKANIAVRDDNYSDATAFRTSVTGQKLVYPIASPVTYQLTPQTVKTLIGRNNIWSDAGDVEVQYWKH